MLSPNFHSLHIQSSRSDFPADDTAFLKKVVLWPTLEPWSLNGPMPKARPVSGNVVLISATPFGVFLDPDRIVQPDDRLGHGEPRFQVTGRINGRLFVIVYTPRAHRLRIISARKANRREVDRHDASTRDS